MRNDLAANTTDFEVTKCLSVAASMLIMLVKPVDRNLTDCAVTQPYTDEYRYETPQQEDPDSLLSPDRTGFGTFLSGCIMALFLIML